MDSVKLHSKLEHIEKQRTILQKRKVSAALKLENVSRNGQDIQPDFLGQLHEEVEAAERELHNFEHRVISRQTREIQTLKRFGVDDDDARTLQVPGIRISSSVSDLTQHPDALEASIDEDSGRKTKDKKQLWSTKSLQGFLDVPPLFRRRSGSDSGGRKYRTMSADVVALPKSTVHNLRLLYTGESHFVVQEEAPVRTEQQESKLDPEAVAEIVAFEKLIENYFARNSRH